MSFLTQLQDEEIAILEKNMSHVQFPRDSCILREGEPGDGCYIVDEGIVRLELKNIETDSDSVIGFLEPGAFLGEFSLLDGKPRSASACAHSAVKTRWFSKESYEEICKQYPQIGLKMAVAMGENLSAKMRELNEKIAGYVFAGDIDKDTHEMVARATRAQKQFEKWPEEHVNALLKDIAETLAERAEELADATVAETGIGVSADKVTKIRFASLEVYKAIAVQQASGEIKTDHQRQITEIASPVGVILGLIPVTNPVSTVAFKTLISLKGRNAIIMSCHRNALGVGTKTVDVIRDILEHHKAPVDLVQAIQKRSSRQKTMMFMNHPGVSLILATGGTSMVKAAYSSGTPAIGVGPGNAPVLICSDADLSAAAQAIIQSKTFDNGIICGSENNLVVVESVRESFTKILEENGAIIVRPDEKHRLAAQIFNSDNYALKISFVGKSAKFIADSANIRRDKEIRLIIVPIKQGELQGPFGHEKLAPVLSLYSVDNEVKGIEVCKQILLNQGRGHTAVIYTQNKDWVQQFGSEIEASRILVNSAAALGCIGIGTGLTPSFTLGCGTFGRNSTTDNVGYAHLLNIKRLALHL